MFHKIKNVSPLPKYKLSVQFVEGVTKIYDVKKLFDKMPIFKTFADNGDFGGVYVDFGGYCKPTFRNVKKLKSQGVCATLLYFCELCIL